MTEEAATACLQAKNLALEARVSGCNARFTPGLSLVLDEEGETKGALLAVLAGAAAPRAGSVDWCGTSLRERLAAAPHTVFWRDPWAPWPEISPEQWARELAARYPTWNEADWQRHVQALALQEHLHKEMFRLSTGSRRKVLLAAALASGAPLTLIDEPEAALDGPSIRHVRAALGHEAERCHETRRVWVVANYEPVPQVPWRQVIRL